MVPPQAIALRAADFARVSAGGRNCAIHRAIPVTPPPLDARKEAAYLPYGRRKGEAVTGEKTEVLQGTLDMLVLRALQLQPMHGWGITERIELWSENVLQLGQGSLYPALYRLERQGLIRSEWRVTENQRRARYYSLTRQGRRQVSLEVARWERMSRAINLVLEATLGRGGA